MKNWQGIITDINLAEVKNAYFQFETICTGAWAHTWAHTYTHTKDLLFIRLILYSPASNREPCSLTE